jgi:hypothetical protein
MTSTRGERILGKTRWRRFAVSFGISMTLVATFLVLMAAGVVALPITISGTHFTVSGSSMTASGVNSFKQYGAVDCTNWGTVPPTGCVGVAVTQITGTTTIDDLDQVVCGPTGLPVPGWQNLKVEIMADQAVATNLIADVDSLSSATASDTATFTNIKIGVPVTSGRTGTTTFGQTADGIALTGFDQGAYYTEAGTFVLHNLHLTASLVAACP